MKSKIASCNILSYPISLPLFIHSTLSLLETRGSSLFEIAFAFLFRVILRYANKIVSNHQKCGEKANICQIKRYGYLILFI